MSYFNKRDAEGSFYGLINDDLANAIWDDFPKQVALKKTTNNNLNNNNGGKTMADKKPLKVVTVLTKTKNNKPFVKSYIDYCNEKTVVPAKDFSKNIIYNGKSKCQKCGKVITNGKPLCYDCYLSRK